VLPKPPYATLSEYEASGGGKGLTAAHAVSAETIIEELVASGLRGRGGAGFPTGVKWRAMRTNASSVLRTTVIVNAAEGEPGTYKDRAILEANPYAVLEGALIAASVLEASSIVIATKARFERQLLRLRGAINECVAAGWSDGVEIRIVEGPSEYLFGEETALLEVVDGRPPFPRIAPPYRRGAVEVVASDGDAASGSGLAAPVMMAGPESDTAAPPTLVNNVETMANVPAIVAYGAEWFKMVGTSDSPGTIVCTVSGSVRRPGVGEVPMGTLLSDVIEQIGGGLQPDRQLKAVMVGVSGSVVGPRHLATPLTHEAMAAIGSSLGSGGYIVVADDQSAVSVAAGVSRFLSVESCGQCTPCKVDGLTIASTLAAVARGEGGSEDLETLGDNIARVADGARCSLAAQHQTVVSSLLNSFAAEFEAQVQLSAKPVGVELIAELLDVASGALDTEFVGKQPDWTYSPTDSGKTPVDLFTDHRTQGPG
jgi:NADH:ubiquinone oxidoreductase subunit F (NADH-binding)